MFWWSYNDDFDEEKTVKLYGCLATKKTFISEERALLHFKRSPDALKLHNKEVVKLQKQHKKKHAETFQGDNPFRIARNSKDPRLARAFYSRYLYLLPLFKTLIESLSKMYVDTWPINTGYTDGNSNNPVYLTIPQIKEKVDHLQSELDKLITKKELDPEPLYKLHEKFFRILHIGQITLDQGSDYCDKKYETDEVGLIVPLASEFHFGHPDYPQVDF